MVAVKCYALVATIGLFALNSKMLVLAAAESANFHCHPPNSLTDT